MTVCILAERIKFNLPAAKGFVYSSNRITERIHSESELVCSIDSINNLPLMMCRRWRVVSMVVAVAASIEIRPAILLVLQEWPVFSQIILAKLNIPAPQAHALRCFWGRSHARSWEDGE